MTTTLDLELVPAVLEIIDELGVSATLTTYGAETYNESTSSVTSRTETSQTLKVSPPARYDSKFVDGDTVRSTDLRIIVPGSGLTVIPEAGMKVVVAGRTYTSHMVSLVYSGDEIAAWIIQLRAGA